MSTITMTKKIDVTYEQPTISASWVSRILGELGQLDLTDREHVFFVPSSCARGVRRGQNLIQPMPKGDRLGHYDWGYSVEKDQYSSKATSVTVWYYKHPDLATPQPEIELIREYLHFVHKLDVSEPTYDYDTVEGFSGTRTERKEYPRWAYVKVSKKPIVPEHFDGCPCGLHDAEA